MNNTSTGMRRSRLGRVGIALAAVAVVVGTVAAGHTAANASQTVTYYELRAQHSDKCVDIEGISLAQGAHAIQWGCWGGHNQMFRLNYIADGYYEIRPWHTDQCLDVYGASTANGAHIIQWGCWGGWNQQFRLNYVGNGFYEIRARHTNKCLDVYGISVADGAHLIQWDCWGGGNQHFKLA